MACSCETDPSSGDGWRAYSPGHRAVRRRLGTPCRRSERRPDRRRPFGRPCLFASAGRTAFRGRGRGPAFHRRRTPDYAPRDRSLGHFGAQGAEQADRPIGPFRNPARPQRQGRGPGSSGPRAGRRQNLHAPCPADDGRRRPGQGRGRRRGMRPVPCSDRRRRRRLGRGGRRRPPMGPAEGAPARRAEWSGRTAPARPRRRPPNPGRAG